MPYQHCCLVYRKRLAPDQAQTSLALPRASIAIWSPLLAHLHSLHPTLPLRLVTAIASRLARPSSTSKGDDDFTAETVSLATEEPKSDPTYDLCLASWAKQIVDDSPCGMADADNAADLRESLVVRIVSTLGLGLGAEAQSKA